jgi:DNA phosphorothioation-associated putative methyltransferase
MREDLEQLPTGKKLPNAVYIHRRHQGLLPKDVLTLIESACRSAHLEPEDYDVVKISADGRRVSLLAYPEFFLDGFPVLRQSWSLSSDEAQVHHRDYRQHWNPPVLHRKELLLLPNDREVEVFSALTEEAERLGLFEDPSTIGLLLPWRETLRSKAVRVVGHRLVPAEPGIADEPPEEVFRFRTALRRTGLSTPMQALMRYGFLDGSNSVFDYGCGHGDDLSALEELGVPASGWDPYFRKDGVRVEADIVNLGFVLNVIEDLAERREALQGAFSLARKLLVVAVLVGGRTAYERYRLYRDGVLTARSTFQKYFTQEELAEYLEHHLGRQPIAVAPGAFFVFKDDGTEQAFLASRLVSTQRTIRLPRRERPPRTAAPGASKPRKSTKWEAAKASLDDFFQTACELGREPAADEWDRFAELREIGSPKRVLARLLEERGNPLFLQGRRRRMDDLTVYLALNLFERRRSFAVLPPSIQRDIKAFWGSHKQAIENARTLLFSLGDPHNVVIASRMAAKEHLGYLDSDEAFFFHSSVVGRLPNELRALVGCASRLFGEIETADLVKIHSRTGKVSILSYDDFDESPLPLLAERVKIDLRRQDLIFVNHAAQPEGRQVLYFKSRYLPPDYPGFGEQQRFDAALSCAHFLDFSGFGPTYPALMQALSDHGWRLEGFTLNMPS